MKTRHRARRSSAQRQNAIALFREWDAAMIRRHGRMYHRKMGYTLH